MRIISNNELAIVSGGAGSQTVEVTGQKLPKPIDPVNTTPSSTSGTASSNGTGSGMGALILKSIDNKIPSTLPPVVCYGSSQSDVVDCKVIMTTRVGSTSNLPRQAEK